MATQKLLTDEEWINLGKEFCDFKFRINVCWKLIHNYFGKSNITSKKITSIYNKFNLNLTSRLDDLVCNAYPREVDYIEEFPIVHVFYDHAERKRIEPNFLMNIKDSYPKKLPPEELQFVETLISDLKLFLQKIQSNENLFKLEKLFKRKLLRQGFKLKIRIDKVLHDVNSFPSIPPL